MTDTRITGHYAAKGPDTSLIGVVLGNYRITAALSGGGMGTVYRAQHELLDRPAAIKLLRPELSENDDLVQRFFDEAKAATAIRHPGIIEVFDFGYTDAGHAYFVMEFLDGVPLSRAIAERAQFPEHEAASIARSIASALKAAHAKGIVHRDLKPDNVFLIPDPDGREARVKVLDFGIAKLTTSSTSSSDRRRTMTGVLLGTPKYMAPEQAREAGTIDARADLYSLGCIFYEMLVGRPPFEAEGAGEIIAMQLFNQPEPPSKLAMISPEMEAIVLKLLEKDPKQRYQSAREVMDALVSVGAQMSGARSASYAVESRTSARVSQVEAAPAASPAQVTAPAKPRWLLPVLLASAALAAIATVAVVLTREHEPAARPQPAAPPPVVPVAETKAEPPVVPPVTPAAPVAETKAEPAQPVVAPPPPVAPPAPVGSVKKKRTVKTGGKIETGKKALDEVASPPPPVETKPKSTGPMTEKGSPIETGLEDTPKKNP